MTTLIRSLSVLAVSLALGACTQDTTEEQAPTETSEEMQTPAPKPAEEVTPPAAPSDSKLAPRMETLEWIVLPDTQLARVARAETR
jgi:hypothetical protein